MMAIKIRRRVPTLNADGRAKPGRFHGVVEDAVLVKRGEMRSWVRLGNGDIIKRKNTDILERSEGERSEWAKVQDDQAQSPLSISSEPNDHPSTQASATQFVTPHPAAEVPMSAANGTNASAFASSEEKPI